jgi:hypothetical protein
MLYPVQPEKEGLQLANCLATAIQILVIYTFLQCLLILCFSAMLLFVGEKESRFMRSSCCLCMLCLVIERQSIVITALSVGIYMITAE